MLLDSSVIKNKKKKEKHLDSRLEKSRKLSQSTVVKPFFCSNPIKVGMVMRQGEVEILDFHFRPTWFFVLPYPCLALHGWANCSASSPPLGIS